MPRSEVGLTTAAALRGAFGPMSVVVVVALQTAAEAWVEYSKLLAAGADQLEAARADTECGRSEGGSNSVHKTRAHLLAPMESRLAGISGKG